MNAVGPHVHVVDLREVTIHERGMVSLLCWDSRVTVAGERPPELPRNCSGNGPRGQGILLVHVPPVSKSPQPLTAELATPWTNQRWKNAKTISTGRTRRTPKARI
ncbi:hypothetical protein QF035_000659 [Streptomyces umbrinus]|uniref:Transposase n=1 Tax=Streptomyces umbrinus TaxID=67370 RepID=A0ABU0SIJ3_9ACTN|nr:hypothetical protein [Streptomyces umbrinus]